MLCATDERHLKIRIFPSEGRVSYIRKPGKCTGRNVLSITKKNMVFNCPNNSLNVNDPSRNVHIFPQNNPEKLTLFFPHKICGHIFKLSTRLRGSNIITTTTFLLEYSYFLSIFLSFHLNLTNQQRRLKLNIFINFVHIIIIMTTENLFDSNGFFGCLF